MHSEKVEKVTKDECWIRMIDLDNLNAGRLDGNDMKGSLFH